MDIVNEMQSYEALNYTVTAADVEYITCWLRVARMHVNKNNSYSMLLP